MDLLLDKMDRKKGLKYYKHPKGLNKNKIE
jgi:hypothetical protein